MIDTDDWKRKTVSSAKLTATTFPIFRKTGLHGADASELVDHENLS